MLTIPSILNKMQDIIFSYSFKFELDRLQILKYNVIEIIKLFQITSVVQEIISLFIRIHHRTIRLTKQVVF
jgi:hypothetical protein